jgi:hypothetical protein
MTRRTRPKGTDRASSGRARARGATARLRGPVSWTIGAELPDLRPGALQAPEPSSALLGECKGGVPHLGLTGSTARPVCSRRGPRGGGDSRATRCSWVLGDFACAGGPAAGRRRSRSAAGAGRRGRFSGLAETGRGAVGGALELLEPGQAHGAPTVEPCPIEVEALAVVTGLRCQLLQSRGVAVGHGRWRRSWRLTCAARFTGVIRLTIEDRA